MESREWTAIHSPLSTLHSPHSRFPAEGEGVEPPGPFGSCPFSRRVPYQLGKPSVSRSRELNCAFLQSFAAGGSRTHTCAVLETAASAFGLPRLCRQCSEQDSNLQQRDSRSRASAALGYQSVALHWTAEGVEPSSPGCRPGVFPLDHAPVLSPVEGPVGHIAGRDRTSSLGLRRAAL